MAHPRGQTVPEGQIRPALQGEGLRLLCQAGKYSVPEFLEKIVALGTPTTSTAATKEEAATLQSDATRQGKAFISRALEALGSPTEPKIPLPTAAVLSQAHDTNSRRYLQRYE